MDLDRQVIPLVPEELLRLSLRNDTGPVVRVDDVVSNFEVADRRLFLETGVKLLFGGFCG
jgi:hypothetical protein